MEWLDLVVPSAAILALFGVVALVVLAIRQGRAIRRLEERLARSGDAAVDAPLQRIAELQARQRVSQGGLSAGQFRTAGVVALVAIALFAAIGGVWYLFVKDGSSASASSDTPAQPAGASNGSPTTTVPKPVDSTLVPADPPILDDKSAFTVAVFNASGVSGAAADVIAPQLTNEGWTVSKVDNPPDGETGRTQSVVMYAKGKQDVAQNVAKTLGIKRAPPLDGYTSAQTGDADVVVLVGTDIANTASSTP
jgi:LytR cell envelope-related transcriptional attenuator